MGGGMAGLTAAALLGKRGHKVTLLEKGEKTGGYVTGFRRDGFYFDATGAFLAACKPGSEFYAIFSELGLDRELDFLAIPAIRNIYPDFELQLDYRNPAAYVDSLSARFPEHAEALAAYSRLTARLGRQFLAFEKAPLWKKALLPLLYPTLFRCARHSHGAILNRFFKGHHHIIHALSALPTTLPPSRLSYIFVAVLWAKVLKDGVFYPKGGMVRVTDMLRRIIEDTGGVIHTGQEVVEIRQDNGRVTEVVTQDTSRHRADWFIGAMNPFHGQAMLHEPAQLYGKVFNLERYTVSPSALLFYVALPSQALPADWPYFVSLHTSDDPELEAQAIDRGIYKNGLHLVITTPSLLDPELAPPGHHAMKVLVHAPRASVFAEEFPDKASVDKLQQDIFAIIRERTGLDLAGANLFTIQATPQVLMARTGNEEGAMYGFDSALGQVGPGRPPLTTKLDNLLWIGHYNRPAHGIVGSALSGCFAANIIGKRKD
jgi:phytoene dehydrogenase-like protein